jgi:NADH-quinone oxidoreductase subunit G
MAVEGLVRLSVDGQPVQAPAGTRLLDVLRGLGIRVPTLCHDPRLTPYGGCRLCVVARRDGRGGLIASCATPALPGMVIETATPDVVESRRQQLQLLMLNHRLECPSCERHGDCRLQDLLYEYGVPEDRLPFDRLVIPRDEGSPVIVRDAEKCILCGKCVRLCDEVQGVAAIGIVSRGLGARVTTFAERPLDCEFCGQCVNACPVGALLARPYISPVPAWLRTRATTTCSFCSCGCQLTVETHERELVSVTSDGDEEPNRGTLCAKGWLGFDVLSSPERLLRPLVRRDGSLAEASWDEALGVVADAIKESRASGRSIVGVAGSRLTCEDAYLMQRLLRTAGNTPHVGLGPSGGCAALVDGMAAVTDAPRSSASFEDLREADVVLVLRGDPTRTHPLIKTELVQGVGQRGQKLLLAHALSGGLERHAALHLPLEPAGEEPLLHGVMARLLSLHPQAADPLRQLPGFAEWAASLQGYTADAVARATGVEPPALDAFCALLAGARKVVTVVVTGLGIPGDEAAVTRAAAMLDALLGGKGGGVLVLGEKANLHGALDVGMHPAWLPGGRPATYDGARAEMEAAWGHPIAHGPVVPVAAAIHGGSEHQVGVLYLAGQDPVGAWPRGLRGAEAVERARFVVVHDAFLTETARLADVVLPVAVLGERDGSLVGADGVRRRLTRVLTAPAGIPQDGHLFNELGRRLGLALPQGGALEAELKALVNWPLPRPTLRRLVPVRPPVERVPWKGMLLDASPQLFRSGSITDHSRLLQELAPSVALRLSPHDAAEIGVSNGDAVRLSAGGREALLRARLDATVRRGTLVARSRARWDTVASLIRDDEPIAAEIRRS